MTGEKAGLLTVCELGRLGDIVTSEPIFRYLKARHPDRILRWYTRAEYVELLRYSPDIDEIVTVRDAEEYLELKRALPEGTVSVELNFHRHDADGKCDRSADGAAPIGEEVPSLLEQFAVAAGLPPLDETPRFHFRPGLEPTGLPEGYVVFHCSSNGKSRLFPERNWRRLAELFFSAGIPVVELGVHPLLRLKHPLFLDRTGVMDLQLAARIIAESRLVVGVESGFAHIANATGATAVIIAGKLGRYPYYNYYCGRFRRGEGINLVRFYDVYPAALPCETVLTVLRRFIDGDPMSAEDCERFCLLEQIRRLHRAPVVRWARRLTDRLSRLRNGIMFHNLRYSKR